MSVPNSASGFSLPTVTSSSKLPVIILSIFLIITVLALAGCILFYFFKKKTQPVEHTTCPSQPQPVQTIQTLQVGPAYKSSTPDVNAVMSKLNKLIGTSQKHGCDYIKANNATILQEMVTSGDKCSEVTAQLNSMVSAYGFPTDVTQDMQSLYGLITNASCGSGDMIDQTKMQTLTTNLTTAFCS